MVFDDDDDAAAEEFGRDSPLEMFVVSFVPVAGAAPLPAALPEPPPAEPVNLAAELRAMGLMYSMRKPGQLGPGFAWVVLSVCPAAPPCRLPVDEHLVLDLVHGIEVVEQGLCVALIRDVVS